MENFEINQNAINYLQNEADNFKIDGALQWQEVKKMFWELPDSPTFDDILFMQDEKDFKTKTIEEIARDRRQTTAAVIAAKTQHELEAAERSRKVA